MAYSFAQLEARMSRELQQERSPASWSTKDAAGEADFQLAYQAYYTPQGSKKHKRASSLPSRERLYEEEKMLRSSYPPARLTPSPASPRVPVLTPPRSLQRHGDGMEELGLGSAQGSSAFWRNKLSGQSVTKIHATP